MGCDRNEFMEGCNAGYNNYYEDCCMTKGWVIGLWIAFAVFWLIIIFYAVWRARVKANKRDNMMIKSAMRGDPFMY